MAKKRPCDEVLKYRPTESPSRTTVRRCYMEWRKGEGIPERCDQKSCQFHTSPLVWLGKAIKPILDHRDGVKYNNAVENLQFLCPNCNSQLDTHGGGNKGRVVMHKDSYGIRQKGTEKFNYTLPVEPAHLLIRGGSIELEVKKRPKQPKKN